MSSAIQRVGVVFSGGPAPAANAVISAAVSAFRRSGREVFGFKNGYTHLQRYHSVTQRLRRDEHYFVFEDHHLRGLRNSRGIIVGTARANPGRAIGSPADLGDASATEPLKNVYTALVDLDVDALVSIGGDGTLETANILFEYQRLLPAAAKRVRIVHLPKTIDNDYRGIDFTFGFFTAVDTMAQELLNLRADAQATGSYFIVQTQGRHAGWLAYGTAVAGEAHMVVGVEDVVGALASTEPRRDPLTGEMREAICLNVEALADRIVDLVVARARKGKDYGTVVLAEGLAEFLPEGILERVPRDEYGRVSISKLNLASLFAQRASERLEQREGTAKKFTGVQLGYESRCAPPHAFDVMLGCQLGLGAYRALIDRELDGHMVSVKGQLDLQFVPLADLVDPETLRTDVRWVNRESDFYRLARSLETQLE